MKTPRVAVVGAGAVGGYFGGMLARAGVPVTLIGRSRHVDVWRRNGLFLDSANFKATIPVQASTELDAARDADLVLFTVKAIDTEDAARQLARQLELGVPTPVNQTLLALVKLRERQLECLGGDPRE